MAKKVGEMAKKGFSYCRICAILYNSANESHNTHIMDTTVRAFCRSRLLQGYCREEVMEV